MAKILKFAAVAFLCSFFLCSLIAGPAAAIEKMGRPKYDDSGVPYSSSYYLKRPDKVFLSLARREGLPESHFILRIAVGNVLSGCPKLGDLQSEVAISGGRLTVEVGDYTVDLRGLPSNPQYQCGGGQQVPASEVVLGRDDLIGQKVEALELRTGKSVILYDIKISQEMVMLQPSAAMPASASASLGGGFYRPLSIPHIANPLKHWFYPEGTVILFVSGASGKMDPKEMVRDQALRLGLTPLEEIYPDFKSPVVDADYFYYVDKAGRLAGTLPPSGTRRIGSVSVMQPVYGLKGNEAAPSELALYAKRPGTYE